MADTDSAQSQVDERRREILLALFLLLLQQTRDKLSSLSLSYLRGSIQTEHISEGLLEALTDAHTMATGLGRQLAGGTGANTSQNRQFAIAVMVGQAGPLSRLVHDLRSGRYPLGADGTLPKALLARLMLYVLRLRGTANEAYGMAQPPGALFAWRLGATERHCSVCPERAAASPYTHETMPGWPGDGSTPCLANCDCSVEVVGGAEGFPMPEGL